MALNNVDLMGRLVADPEYRKTSGDIGITTFRIAVDRDYVSKESGNREADFISCVAFRGSATFVAQYFGKGDMIAINGRLQSRTYQDQEGNNRTKLEVVCNNCYFGSAKGGSEGHSDGAADTFTQPASDTDTDLPF